MEAPNENALRLLHGYDFAHKEDIDRFLDEQREAPNTNWHLVAIGALAFVVIFGLALGVTVAYLQIFG